jgi:hypothetical protein
MGAGRGLGHSCQRRFQPNVLYQVAFIAFIPVFQRKPAAAVLGQPDYANIKPAAKAVSCM